jgi:hypothetical protein
LGSDLPLLMALGRGGRSSNGRGHCPYRPRSLPPTGIGGRRPPYRRPGGAKDGSTWRNAAGPGVSGRAPQSPVRLLGCCGDRCMISRIAGQLHHNLEVTGKLLGDHPRYRPDHAGLRRVEDRAGRGASSLPAPAIEPRPVILTARDSWSRMVPSPLRPRGQEQAQLLVRAAPLPRPSTAVRLDGQS